MSAPAVLWGQGWVDADDSTLLALVRDGNAEAYAELWRRHLPAAYGVAHRYRGRTSAEDVVAEASLRVYDLIRSGKGPLTNFRSYFLSAVRTIAVDHARGDLRAVPTEDASLEAAAPATAAYDPSPTVDHALVRAAFARLAERDQQVLWQTAVEGTTPAAVADSMGLTANTVSVIALRARDSLRAKYLDAHADRAISRAQDAECAWVLGQMGRFVRGKLPVRQRARVEEHLRSCRHAQGLAYEMAEVNRALPAVIVPLIFLAGSSLVAVWAGAAGAAGAAGGVGASGASVGPREEGKAAAAAALAANVGTKIAALGVAAVLATGYAAAAGVGGGGGGAAGGSGNGGVGPVAAAPVVPGAVPAQPRTAAPSQEAAPSQTAVPSPTAVPSATSSTTTTARSSSTTTTSASTTTSSTSTTPTP
ncbi:MAG TPA: sigma-70 family RNA polymerase sigma factor, partial [Dermatophilaceae bacterium]|nr:sigma-70 family RNA polymerase sigma factor [Dermatophilaceae bacterium]